ncbi:BON domain-containing protein [Holospora undulata]|uniref:BON domain-containing protein n=1 Tax=Holospora undulata HU1 TaxID=1321371 RepID=A0A061JIV9_9PROT|nr:BON domain-containing protein [Holospora undulata]ETZ05244.1 putative protein in gshII 5'region [Holospora undulata HU1]
MFKSRFCTFFYTCIILIGVQGCGILSFNSQDRTVSEAWDDSTIRLKLSQDFLLHDSGLLDGIESLVYQKDVLLVGSVPNEEMKREAEKIAKQVSGVNKVWNEISVGVEYFTDYISDGITEKKIKANLILDDKIKIENYTIRVFKGILYVLGSASDPEELKRLKYYVDQFSLRDAKYFVKFSPKDKKI